MERAVVGAWRDNLTMLNDADAVGCHWIEGPGPFFGGNFWWAHNAFLKTCKTPNMDSRYHAESWLGDNGLCTVYDLAPGWPAPDTFYGT
jgi:hypothetical protein